MTLNNFFPHFHSKQQTIEWDVERVTAFTCLKHFSRLVEMARPRFDRVPSSSMGVSNSVSAGAAGGSGGNNSGAAQGTGRFDVVFVCETSSHNQVGKLRLHLIIACFSFFFLFSFYKQTKNNVLYSKCQCH